MHGKKELSFSASRVGNARMEHNCDSCGTVVTGIRRSLR